MAVLSARRGKAGNPKPHESPRQKRKRPSPISWKKTSDQRNLNAKISRKSSTIFRSGQPSLTVSRTGHTRISSPFSSAVSMFARIACRTSQTGRTKRNAAYYCLFGLFGLLFIIPVHRVELDDPRAPFFLERQQLIFTAGSVRP